MEHPHLILHLPLQSGFHHSIIAQANLEFVFVDFPGHGSSAMLWFGLSASHPTKRHVAPAAAIEVCLAVSGACPACVGDIFPIYATAIYLLSTMKITAF